MHVACPLCLQAPLHFPAVFVQMCQPEGRMALRRVLTSLQPHNSPPASFGTAAAGGPDSCATSTAPSSAQQRSVACVHAQDPLAGDTHRDKGFWHIPAAHSKGRWAACSLDGLPPGALLDATSKGFWEAFAARVHVLCLSEVKCALVAQGVVGVPGVMSLLCNLSTTVNLKLDTDEAAQVRMQVATCGVKLPGVSPGVRACVVACVLACVRACACAKNSPWVQAWTALLNSV